MISTRTLLVAAGLAAVSVSAPVLAGDNNRGSRNYNSGHHYNDYRSSDRNDWRGNRDQQRYYSRNDRRNDRRDRQRAYAAGYRDGAQQPGYGYSSRPPAYGGGYYGNAGYNRPPVYQNSNYWYGNNGRIHCRRDDGTTGAIVGAVTGGTLGNILAQRGDKQLGSIIGGTLGAIIGKELDKGNGYCR